MSREWKPGAVAVVTVFSQEHIALRTTGGWRNAWAGDCLGEVTDARPLVVIDPEDREEVERLIGAVHHVDPDGIEPHDIDEMQAALREFANPTPPKPEEPGGLGAVVEDANGVLWIRADGDGLPWLNSESSGDYWLAYADIAVVRVLSEGVAVR